MLTRTSPLHERTPATSSKGAPVLRLLAVLLPLALAGFAWLDHRNWQAAQQELERQAQNLGVTGSELADLNRRMLREADPAAARLVLAARLFDVEVTQRDPGSPASAERLVATRELARAVLREEPASWQAAMLLGAAISLERSRNRDTRLFSLSRDWERPLVVAGELGPAELQPRRLLAAAYLEVWPALAPEKRQKVETMLREAFLEPQTFERLYAPWVQIAGSLERAATLLPDRPVTWKRLAATAFERQAWGDYEALTHKYRAALRDGFARDLELAAQESESGDIGTARRRYDRILVEAPVDAEFLPLVEQALGRLPPGPATDAQASSAETWLAWAQPLCLVRDCPFAPPAMARLASLAGSRLSGGEAAFAALAADDLQRADLLERRSEELWSEPWAPFVTLKAKRQAARREIPAARTTLLAAHRSFRGRLAWRLLAERYAAVGVHPGPPLARESWEASDWWFDKGTSRLDLLPARPAKALRLELTEPARAPGLLEIQWDGRALAPLAVAVGASTIYVPLTSSGAAAAAEPHLLEVRVRTGDLRPASRVRLE